MTVQFVDEKQLNVYIMGNKVADIIRMVNSSGSQNEVIDLLIRKLQTAKESAHRQTIAVALAEMKCNKAVKAIVAVINKNCHTSDYAGLVYVLLDMECARYIKDISHLCYDGNYMVRRYMNELINKNMDRISVDDLKIIKDDLKQAQGELKDKYDGVTALLKKLSD